MPACPRTPARSYTAFFTFAKAKLKAGLGVVTVAYLAGLSDPDYDHIVSDQISTLLPACLAERRWRWGTECFA